MVALQLQDALAEEIKNLTSHMRLKNPRGEDVPLNVFKQNLPIVLRENKEILPGDEELDEDYQNQEEEAGKHFPYCIVKLDSGGSEDAESAHIIKTVLVVGLYDDSLEANGYRNILNIFEDIRQRFRKNPILNGQYQAEEKISWALPDDDMETNPYCFGAMYMEWITAEIRREDPLA